MTDRHEQFRSLDRPEKQPLGHGRSPVNICSDPTRAGRRRLEVAARAQIELRAGRSFSDGEWAEVRSILIEFTRILTAWHQQARTNRPQAIVEVSTDEMLPKAA